MQQQIPTSRQSQIILPNSFEPENHWYPKALNATIHPLVQFFMNLEEDRIISRYCHLKPKVSPQKLKDLLHYQPKYFFWAGADLMHVTNENGKRMMVVIENNSCPSGQKSMPLIIDNQEQGGYKSLVERTIGPKIKNRKRKLEGNLAVVYDKNLMEAKGYAHAMADYFKEPIHLVPFYKDDPNPPVRFSDGIMEIRNHESNWLPIRASFRYLTQKPWNRLPIHSKTLIINPVIACLAGGRNKMIAAKAYDFYNTELVGSGLEIFTPETIWDVSKAEVPLWIKKMGGQAVVKNPYSNAGQGVYTIINDKELERFMATNFEYERFIVQSLIGNYHWSSMTTKGKLYHVGTMPNQKGNTYAADLRMMVSGTVEGIKPLAIYARRAKDPLANLVEWGMDSWNMLGTNLSIKNDDGSWGSDTKRLLLTDRRDFNKLGLGLDDLIEAYIQTVLSMIAIDQMAQTLFNSKKRFRLRLFKSLDNDPALINEFMLD